LKKIAYEALYSGLNQSLKNNQLLHNDKKKAVLKNISDINNFDFDKSDINYVLIIDEINRGNISKILGELITLIESDKRLGESGQIICALPYSSEKFILPPNLYIIGTMNTADRSIALLDSALRRRFSFRPFYPQSELLGQNAQGLNIDLTDLLETMNQRIECLYDRDHTIGHSYFLDIKTNEELISVFKDKIIPLLEEYFYNDLEKVGQVLGGIGSNENDGFIVYKKQYNSNLFHHKSFASVSINERYAIKNEFGIAEILKIVEC